MQPPFHGSDRGQLGCLSDYGYLSAKAVVAWLGISVAVAVQVGRARPGSVQPELRWIGPACGYAGNA